MANDFIVEYTEDGLRKRDRVQASNDVGGVPEMQRIVERNWGASLPERKDIKVIGIYGSGRVERVDIPNVSTPENDAAIIAKGIKKAGGGNA